MDDCHDIRLYHGLEDHVNRDIGNRRQCYIHLDRIRCGRMAGRVSADAKALDRRLSIDHVPVLFNRETAILDWARAIERNKDALTSIVAALFAMLGLEAGATLGRIPRELHRSVLRVLRSAESAVRRLIVIAARGLVLKPVASRPWQKGRVIKKGSKPSLSFALFDTRKRFDFNRPGRIPDHKRPRIWVFDDTPPNVRVFRPEDFGRSVPEKEEDALIDAARLGRRLMAIKLALEDLPRQARRLVRLKARREALQKQGRPVFISPMRHGRPPGYRKRPRHEVDEVLIECHGLARDVERLDTS